MLFVRHGQSMITRISEKVVLDTHTSSASLCFSKNYFSSSVVIPRTSPTYVEKLHKFGQNLDFSLGRAAFGGGTNFSKSQKKDPPTMIMGDDRMGG